MKSEPRTSFGYMPFYFGDYDADTGHLSTLEHGVYFLLIKAYWKSSRALPDNDPKLANLARLPLDEWRMMKATVAEFFVIQDGFWFHKRIERELAHFRDKSAKAKKSREVGIQKAKEAAKRSDEQSLFATDEQRTFDERSTIGDRSTFVEVKNHSESNNYNGISKHVNGRSTYVQRPIDYSDSDTDKYNTCSATEESSGLEVLEKRGNRRNVKEPPVSDEFEIDEFFERIYIAHPKKRDRTLAETYLSQSLGSGADPREIERVHGLYCSEVWAKDKPQFAPTLAQWILDRGWKYPPELNGVVHSEQKSKYQELSIPKPPED